VNAPHAALYVRVSTDAQSTENHLPDVERLARTRRLAIVATFEEAVSARRRRPVFERMMSDAKLGLLRSATTAFLRTPASRGRWTLRSAGHGGSSRVDPHLIGMSMNSPFSLNTSENFPASAFARSSGDNGMSCMANDNSFP